MINYNHKKISKMAANAADNEKNVRESLLDNDSSRNSRKFRKGANDEDKAIKQEHLNGFI